MIGQDLEQDVEVTNCAEAPPDLAQVPAIAAHGLRLEAVPKDTPRGARPARRDPHRVDLLGILTGDDARHAGEHPREVEAEDLATGLCPQVVAANAGCPADHETLDRLLCSTGRRVVVVVLSSCASELRISRHHVSVAAIPQDSARC